MEIVKLDLQNYGKFQNKQIELDRQLNIIYGKNEQGKSTVHNFIEGILTGLNSARYGLESDNKRFERYKPWGQQEQFNGELTYVDKDNEFRVYRDFSKTEAGIEFFEKGEKVKIKQTNKEFDENKQYLNVLGITDISNKTGTSLIEELKNYISNVGSTNTAEISVEEAIEGIDTKLTEIEETTNYKELQEEIERYRHKLNEVVKSQSEQKEALKAYFVMENKRQEVQKQLDKVENHLEAYIQSHDQMKEQQYEEYERQILLLQEEMESLTKAQEESYEELDKTMDLKSEYQSNSNKISEYEDEITQLLEEKRLAHKDITSKMEHVLSIPAERKDLLNSFKDYLQSKEQLDEIDAEILKLQKSIADEASMKAMTNDGGNIVFEHLDRDYQNLINLENWKHTLIKGGENAESTEAVQETIDKETKTKGNLRLALTGLQIVLLLSIIGGFLVSNFLWVFAILFVSIAILSFVIFKKYKEISRELNLSLSRVQEIQETAIKNKERIEKSKVKIKRLLDKYKLTTMEEFSVYFQEQKKEKEFKKNYLSRLDEALTKKDDFRSDEQIRRTYMHDWFYKIGVHQDESYDLDKKTYERLELIIERSDNLFVMDQQIKEVEEKVKEIKYINFALAKEIKENDTLLASKKQNLSEKQSSKEEWNRLNQQLEDLKARHHEGLQDDGEKERLQIKKKELKEEVELCQQEKEKARLHANSIVSDRLVHSRVNKKVEQLTVKVDKIEQQLYVLREAKKSIQAMVLRLLETFKESLNGKINSLVYQVTGKYKEVIFDKDMDIYVIDDISQEKVGIENLSMGTIDQIYFALRVGLINAVSDNVVVPLILDDCFAQYDDERLMNILKEVAKLKRQVIIFTCHTREKEIFDQLRVDYNYVEL